MVLQYYFKCIFQSRFQPAPGVIAESCAALIPNSLNGATSAPDQFDALSSFVELDRLLFMSHSVQTSREWKRRALFLFDLELKVSLLVQITPFSLIKVNPASSSSDSFNAVLQHRCEERC
jgi:hypothetical protein